MNDTRRPSLLRPPLGGDRAMEQAAQLLDAHHKLTAAVGDLTSLIDKITPGVIGVHTHVLDANGTAAGQFRVPFKSLHVDHHGASPTTVTAAGTVAAPGAGVQIAGTNLLAAGTWRITAQVAIAGTPAAATDTGNMNLYLFPANVHEGIAVPGIAGGTGSLTVTVTMPAGGGTASVFSTGAATAGTVYTASITADPVDSPASTLVVAAAPLQGAVTAAGPGVAALRRNGSAVVNFRAYQWSVYGGTAGDLVTVTAFAQPQPPNTR